MAACAAGELVIPHERPLLPCRFLARYDRFIASVELDGEVVDAHCVNPGRMEGLVHPGARAWVSAAPARSKRKLRYTLELLEIEGRYVGANTVVPNRLAEILVREGCVPGLKRFRSLAREVRYGENSRIDLLLQSDGRADCYVEIKSVTLRRHGPAEFPDAVTARGTKHLGELSEMVQGGARAVMFYLVQREDCRAFSIAADIDPIYAKALAAARGGGVEVICYACRLTTEAIEIAGKLPLEP